MDEIAFRSAGELATMLRSGAIGSVELLQHYLDRIDRHNPHLNAVVALNPDAAMARARQADSALKAGKVWGPLHGVPITIKDALEVTGMPTTGGATELRDHQPTENAVAAQRLIDAGAIVFGKTNLPLYSGDLQSYNQIYGTTNNPWDLARTPGGSSGGAAAAVAAGLTAMELGSDIGGSIRTPSHFCGIYGHKPSWGLVATRGHIPGPPGSVSESDINVVGPMARAPEDLHLALNILNGSDPLLGPSRTANLLPVSDKPLKGMRIAAWLDDAVCPVDRATGDRLQMLADALARAGASVNDKARPDFDAKFAFATYTQLLMAVIGTGFPEPALERMRKVAQQTDRRDMSFTARSAIGATQTHRQWLSANEARNRIRARWADLFKEYDVLLCPVSPTPAFPHDHSVDQMARQISVDGRQFSYMEQIFWAGVVGMAYLPSTSTPIGRTPAGLPVGVQVVGPYHGDLTTIRFAGQLREITEGFVPPPGYL